MSSYLLSKEEFQLISDWLYMEGSSKQSRHAHYIKSFIGFEAGTDEHFHASSEEISNKVKNSVRHLYNLNRLALTTRYGESYDRNDETQFIPSYNPMANERKVIELLISLRYQCGEYIVCETKSYGFLKELIGELCENIFSRTK